MSDMHHIIGGYRLYKNSKFAEHKHIYTHRRRLGERPHTLVITSCSLPVGVETLTGAGAGDLYVIRNMGAIVPPYGASGAAGTVAAVDYAVNELEVKNIIILNHRHCDGVHMMMNDDHLADADADEDPMAPWLRTMKDVRIAVDNALEGKSEEEREDVCVHEVVVASMRNLLQYPFVVEAIKKKGFPNVYGMHFDLEAGELEVFNPNTGNFDIIS